MNEELTTPCDFAKRHYFNASRWLNLWTILLYAFGVAVVLFLITAILLFIRSTWLPGALTTLGTIVNSAGIVWVAKQRMTAADEEEKAAKRLDEQCKSSSQGLGLKAPPRFTETGEFQELRLGAWKSLLWPKAAVAVPPPAGPTASTQA